MGKPRGWGEGGREGGISLITKPYCKTKEKERELCDRVYLPSTVNAKKKKKKERKEKK
jgi:hypothetical protein